MDERELDELLQHNNFSLYIRHGVDRLGVEFVQWVEQQIDTIPGFVRVGKSVLPDCVIIHIDTATASTGEHK